MVDVISIANRLGGVEPLREKLTEKLPGVRLTASTIYNWQHRQRISGTWEFPLVEVAKDHGITLTLADLRSHVPPPPAKGKRAPMASKKARGRR